LHAARQLAISQRTTVYMVFVPTNFWNDPAFSNPNFTLADRTAFTNLFDKQTIGYNFVSLRSLGDQPGRPSVRLSFILEGSAFKVGSSIRKIPGVPAEQAL
jgi:hypothetical protein